MEQEDIKQRFIRDCTRENVDDLVACLRGEPRGRREGVLPVLAWFLSL